MKNTPSTTPNGERAYLVRTQAIEKFFGTCMPLFDERSRRIVGASFADMLGHGGKKVVAEITDLSYPTIAKGAEEIASLPSDPKARRSVKEEVRVRAEGGGRKTAAELHPEITEKLADLLEGHVVGNPENPLCWTTKSTYTLSALLLENGIKVSPNTIGNILKEQGFSLQQNRKYTEKGEKSPDRNAQFEFINDQCKAFLAKNLPVISVDTKKKELVGEFKNAGQEYRKKGTPRKVNGHDFMGPEGKAAPYGVYDINRNEGFVNVGTSSDTAEFAAFSIKRWWETMGKERYPDAKDLMITADCGGSNSVRGRLWKVELQKLANEFGLNIHVSHFPPGTSKWNKIEHRLFAQISRTWRAQPLETLEVIVLLIASTTTKTGLIVKCELDEKEYQRGIKVSDEEMAAVNLKRNDWRGDWNYTISPNSEN